MSHCHLVYRKACHLPVEIEYQPYCAMSINLDFNLLSKKRLLELSELEEFKQHAYKMPK